MHSAQSLDHMQCFVTLISRAQIFTCSPTTVMGIARYSVHTAETEMATTPYYEATPYYTHTSC